MKKAKRYEIETIEQLVNVSTVENYERLGIDFLLWLNQINQTFKGIKEKNPDLKDKLNSEIAKVKFVWIDDGKHDFKEATLKNETTGEVKNIKIKK